MRSHLAVWLVCGFAATWAGEGASAPPATQVALDWNLMWEGVLAACAGAAKDNASLAAFQAKASENTGNKEIAAWKYESNVEIDYDRGMACKRKNPAGPYYHVRLSIHGIRTRGFTEVAPDKPSVAWDGKSSRREYGIPWMKLGIGLTVLSDDPDFVKAINAILDQEITRALRRSATQPEAARAGRLAKSLKANRAGFALAIEYRAPEAEMQLPEKGDFTLTLSVPRQPEPEMANRRVVRIAEAEADRIIDYLAAEEAFLGKANDVMGKGIGGGPRPGCTWLVWGANGPMLHQPERSHPMLLRESVPAGPMMLARLDGLRIVLDGEAAKAMDQLLKRIGPHRKEWEKAQPTVE